MTDQFTLSPTFCMYNGAAIVSQNENYIQFGLTKPGDTQLRLRLFHAFSSYLRDKQNMKEPVISFSPLTRQQLLRYVSLLFGQNSPPASLSAVVTEAQKKKEEAAAVLLLDSLLDEARSLGATDIHIEWNTVRFRLNGRLVFHLMLQPLRCQELVLRIKLLSGMNILEKIQSQDGHFSVGREKKLFVRVSCMSIISSDGRNDGDESVVMRLLDSVRVAPDIDTLGFTAEQSEKLRGWCRIPYGLILICGATGAGKSTTAAALLSEIVKNVSNKKIISLEDPVEYVLPNVTQIQISNKVQNNFGTALRCVFRQDPDVLFIGEIRDEITAKTAIQASLTGHLVFATLHTTGANEALLRLKSLGADENLARIVLRGVVTQSLSYTQDKAVMTAFLESFIPSAGKRTAVSPLLPVQNISRTGSKKAAL